MHVDEILSRAARLLANNRLLWPLGLLMVCGSLVYGLVWRLFGLLLVNVDGLEPGTAVVSVAEAWVRRPVGPILGFVVLLLAGMVFWLIAVAAEGGMIRTTVLLEADQTVSLHQAWTDGRRLLARFVAIDTILFFPLFVLLLAIMLVSSAGFIGTILANLQGGGTFENILQGMGLTAAVVMPFICLTLPVGVITFFLRLAAFREAALSNSSTRESIRDGWHTIRLNPAAAAGLVILLAAIRYLVRMLLSMLTVPLAIPGIMVLVGPWLGIPRASGLALLAVATGLLAVVINAAGGGILSAYGSICWTLAYRSWSAKRLESRR